MGAKSSNSLRDLGLGLSFVFGAFVLALMAELCYIFCWKSRVAGAVVIVDKSAPTSSSRQYCRTILSCCCCCVPGGVCRRQVLLLEYWRRREPLPTLSRTCTTAAGSSSSDARSRSKLTDGTTNNRPPVHVHVDSNKNNSKMPPPANVDRGRSRGRRFQRLLACSGVAWRQHSMAGSICSVTVPDASSAAISAGNFRRNKSSSGCSCGESAAVAEQPAPPYYNASYNIGSISGGGGLFPIREDSNEEDVTSTSTVCDLEIVVEESPTSSSCSHSTSDGFCAAAAAITSTSNATTSSMYAASGAAAAGLIIAGHHRRRELRRASSNCSYFDHTQARRNSGGSSSSYIDIHDGRNYGARGAQKAAVIMGEARDNYKSAAAAARSMHSISAGALISSAASYHCNYLQQKDKDNGSFCGHQNRAATAAHGRLEEVSVEERNPNVAADMARISLRLLFERSPVNVASRNDGGSVGAERGTREEAVVGSSTLTPEYARQKLQAFFRHH